MVIEAVIFDLDGLILDSETPEVLAWQAAYARYGLGFPLESWLKNIGRNDRPWDPLAIFRGPDSPAPPEEVAAVWRERHDVVAADYLKPLPGVVPLLAAVRRAGWRTGVASSSRRSWILKALADLALTSQFDAAAGGDEVPRAKPAPDVYLLAAHRLGAAPAACVALEDSPHGTQAAKAAGMACIAVPSLLTRSMDFSAADLVVRSLEEVTAETIASLDAA
ncbi:MAG TPA: HAD family phosphatase [bacterium]|nr:HAD family phosphatase [bacterium]